MTNNHSVWKLFYKSHLTALWTKSFEFLRQNSQLNSDLKWPKRHSWWFSNTVQQYGLFSNFCKVDLMAYFDLKWTVWPLDQEVWSLDFDRKILFTFKWTLPTFHLMAPSTHILRKSEFEIIEKVSDGWHQTMLRDIEMNFFIITKQKLCGNFRSRSRFMLRFPNDSITLRIISTNESRLQHSLSLCSKKHSFKNLLKSIQIHLLK